MRKFFAFRSTIVSSGKDDPVPVGPSTGNIFSERHWEDSTKSFAHAEVRETCQTKEKSASPCLRRSVSFSSPVCYSSGTEWNNSLCHPSGSICHSASLHQNASVHADYLLQAPEMSPRLETNNHSENLDVLEKFDSPSSYRKCHGSVQNSPYSSVSVRCACVTQISDKNDIVDVYTDGEQHHTKLDEGYRQSSCTGNDCCLVENIRLPTSGCSPRFRHTAPASPNYSENNMRSCSFSKEKGICHHMFTQDHTRDDLHPLSPRRYARKIIQRLSHVLPGTPKVKLQDYGSETTSTIEDIYEDTSNLCCSTADNPVHKCALLDHKPLLVYETADGYRREQALFFKRQIHFLGDDHMSSKLESSHCLEKHTEEIDRELLKKLKETEERITLQPEMGTEIEKLRSGTCTSALAQMVRNIIEDRDKLRLELSSQLHSRIAERSSMKEALRQAKIDLHTRIKKLANEKNELHTNLESELDRRSSDWLLMLEKFQAEECKLRECMRELAEQNVSLQREVVSISGREIEARSRIMDSELQFNSVTRLLEEARNENEKLHQVLSELQERCDGVKADQDCIGRNYKEKEKENKELKKAVVRLQRMCNEQEKTINGMRQGFNDEVMMQSSERAELVRQMQNEHVRLLGVEQKLRRELESYRFEVESLRHENVHLLERLRGVENSSGISFFRLDQELLARVDCLKSQALSLLDDNSELCAKLLVLVKGRQYEHGQEATDEFNGYSVLEYSMKLQSLRKAAQILRCSLQMLSKTLDEKSTTKASECQLQAAEGGLSRQWKSEASVDEMEYELKAEILLTTVLREKLCYKELELEQLQSELANSVQGNEILKSEIQRLQDDLSCLRYKIKDTELQMLKKDDNLNQLHCDLQGCTRELVMVRGTLPKISEERDHLWEEVKQLKEVNMLLECEVKSLKKKIEALDEDILMKEGQITMLMDNLGGKPFALEFSSE